MVLIIDDWKETRNAPWGSLQRHSHLVLAARKVARHGYYAVERHANIFVIKIAIEAIVDLSPERFDDEAWVESVPLYGEFCKDRVIEDEQRWLQRIDSKLGGLCPSVA